MISLSLIHQINKNMCKDIRPNYFTTSISLVIFFAQIYYIWCIFPLEQDVAEMTGVSLSKSWMVFMEKRVQTCVLGLSRHRMIGLLKCLAPKSATQLCFYKRNHFIKGRKKFSYCVLALMEPNILKVYSLFEYYRSITIKVHKMFDINITVSLFRYVHQDIRRENRLSDVYMEIILNGSKHQYRGTRYPWSFIHTHHSLSIRFVRFRYHEVNLEYSILKRGVFREYSQLSLFAFSYILERYWMNYVHIRVDRRTRVALKLLPCLPCKIITYDGPNELLPTILRISKGMVKTKELIASTFQVFVVVIQVGKTSAMGLTYKPVYHSKSFNYTKGTYKDIAFDNNTNCGGRCTLVRSCVYEIRSLNPLNFQLSIRNLFFNGIYRGSEFAGFLLLADDGESTEAICEFYDIFAVDPYELNITVTGTHLYVVIYSYSVYGLLSVDVFISATECVGYFLDRSSWTHAPFLESRNLPKIRYVLDWTSFNNETRVFCIKVHLLQLVYFNQKKYQPYLEYEFSLETNTPVMVILDYRTLLGIPETYTFGVFPFVAGIYHTDQISYHRNANYAHARYLTTNLAMKILEYRKFRFYAIAIQSSPCVVNDNWLGLGKHQLQNRVINICDKYYVTCKSRWLYPRPSSTIQIQFHPQDTQGIFLYLRGFDAQFELRIYGNRTILIPEFKGSPIRITIPKCKERDPIEISRQSVTVFRSDVLGGRHFKNSVIKTKFWKGRGYTYISNLGYISLNKAAAICHSGFGYMLTVDTADEYEFIKEGFLSGSVNHVLYVGARWKVTSLIARFMGPTWGPSGADRTQVDPMLAPWTFLSGVS